MLCFEGYVGKIVSFLMFLTSRHSIHYWDDAGHPWIFGNAEMDMAFSATISREIGSSSRDDAQMDFGQCTDGHGF